MGSGTACAWPPRRPHFALRSTQLLHIASWWTPHYITPTAVWRQSGSARSDSSDIINIRFILTGCFLVLHPNHSHSGSSACWAGY